jgi:hypothetical protein
MGISDKDYADALIYEKQKQAAQQQTKEMAGTVLANCTTNTNTITLTTPNTGGMIWASPPTGIKTLTEQDLRHEGMKAPLSALVDMWTVRWGGEWVGETEFQEDDFWRIALVRLTGANKLEKHNLANQYMSVYRIIE